jgi:hypothetical protein
MEQGAVCVTDLIVHVLDEAPDHRLLLDLQSYMAVHDPCHSHHHHHHHHHGTRISQMAFQQNQPANMIYRDQRDRTRRDVSNDLESYADGSIVPFYRQYQSHGRRPNHDYLPQIFTAVRTSNNIVSSSIHGNSDLK